jgi:hypothetical protein
MLCTLIYYEEGMAMTEPVQVGSWLIGIVSNLVIARVTRQLSAGSDPIWEICEPGAGTYAAPESFFTWSILKSRRTVDFPMSQGSVVRVNLAAEMTGLTTGPGEARAEALFVVTWWSDLPNNPVDDPVPVAHCIPISVGRGSRGEQYAWDETALTLVTPGPPQKL